MRPYVYRARARWLRTANRVASGRVWPVTIISIKETSACFSIHQASPMPETAGSLLSFSRLVRVDELACRWFRVIFPIVFLIATRHQVWAHGCGPFVAGRAIAPVLGIDEYFYQADRLPR